MIKITAERAEEIAWENFQIKGKAERLDGYDDANFKIVAEDNTGYLLKISEGVPTEFLDFQIDISDFLCRKELLFQVPQSLHNEAGNALTRIDDQHVARLLTWLPGRLWAGVNPKTKELRSELGEAAGRMTEALKNFGHPGGHRHIDWDLARADWVFDYIDGLEPENRPILRHFWDRFNDIKPIYEELPKQIVHNDLNDYNIFVSENVQKPKIEGIIDFGDAVYTQTTNDAAILLSYAITDLPDPLSAAQEVLRGYQRYYRFSVKELECLYTLIGLRLAVTIINAKRQQKNQPEDPYYTVSLDSAWRLLKKWEALNENFVYYAFRAACGYTAHPEEGFFKNWAERNQISLTTLFPSIHKNSKQELSISTIDMSVGSRFLGNRSEYNDVELTSFKIDQLRKQNPNSIFANGYMEPRVFYTTPAFRDPTNTGYEHRTKHLGVDFWLPVDTPVHAPFEATVKVVHHNDFEKDYGPMLILAHEFEGHPFYSLYGHLSLSSLKIVEPGQHINQGDLIGYIGDSGINGHWPPHLHFQLIMDLMGHNENFDGVARPSETDIWESLSPDPNFIFKEDLVPGKKDMDDKTIINFRDRHFGKSLSLTYNNPLHIVRGEDGHLIDKQGQQYLDTVNNVNHVGHEHPKVVRRGQAQMGVLNTNTRYLHEEIIDYSKALLEKLPDHLSVIHFVNSGSEANELALRMVKTATGQKDMLANEIGYHGNSNAVMDVSSYKFDGPGGKGKPEHTHIIPLPDPFRGKYTGPESGSQYAEHAKTIIESLVNRGRNLAGYISENIISCGGQIVPPDGFLKQVYQYVHQAGGICIADEVQTGFGRMGQAFWAFELFNLEPDIVTMGKPAGNGHPVAAVACTQSIAEQFNNGVEYFNTFGGNPVSCAIGKSVLEVIEEDNLQENALIIGDYLKSQLNRLQTEFPIIVDVRGEGLFLGFELADAHKNPLPEQADYLMDRMRELHILMSTEGPDHNVLKIKPALTFSKNNADALISTLKQVLSEDFMLLNFRK